MGALRDGPHRISVDELAPNGKRVKVGEVLAQLTVAGLDQLGADDLERYRLLLSPAEFKRLEHRLVKAIADHWAQVNRSAWTEPGLPFGADIDAEVKQDRLRVWAFRPNGETVLTTWTLHDEFDIAGRLKLTAGREFSVWGFRGRLLFRRAVTTTTGDTWVDGWDEDGACRSISPERIRTVHRKARRCSLRERLS